MSKSFPIQISKVHSKRVTTFASYNSFHISDINIQKIYPFIIHVMYTYEWINMERINAFLKQKSLNATFLHVRATIQGERHAMAYMYVHVYIYIYPNEE